jgi:23S rRNA (cytidine1920-2'-O)/16S rRNA (cytidine1409-2'-O)-methyltransferase
MARQALDRALVSRGLCASTDEAKSLIRNGVVLVSGSIALNPGRQVAADEAILLKEAAHQFVGRGGLKMARALERFDLEVEGRSAIDAGSAVGGFTDALLQAGVVRVLAVDVGYGQLHERLRSDPRVVNLERTNIRSLTRVGAISLTDPLPPPTLLTADLSFSSLDSHVGHFIALLEGKGDLIVLCKPQFEVDRELATKLRGVIRSNHERRSSLERVCAALRRGGASIGGIVSSPILGPAGNAEFLIHASLTNLSDALDIDEQIAEAVRIAGALK